MCARYAIALLVLLSPIMTLANNQPEHCLADTIIGHDFFQKFRWETVDDPTHGRVNYVDQPTARERNYSYANDGKFIMSPNSKDIVPPDARGRDSVRITSLKTYDEFIVTIDLQHMPEGCSTWPAFWTYSRAGPWPNGGEVDIVEGANLDTCNEATLHTSAGCAMPQSRNQTGTTVTTNCDANVNYNIGCGTSFAPDSYGAGFNNNGGGWYVMRKSRERGISVWFWRRDDRTVPREVVDGRSRVSPNWRTPDAHFPTEEGQCEYDNYFDAHQIVINLTFCGDKAGNEYSASGCAGTCQEFVDYNPQAFEKAYWEINSLRVYTPQVS